MTSSEYSFVNSSPEFVRKETKLFLVIFGRFHNMPRYLPLSVKIKFSIFCVYISLLRILIASWHFLVEV